MPLICAAAASSKPVSNAAASALLMFKRLTPYDTTTGTFIRVPKAQIQANFRRLTQTEGSTAIDLPCQAADGQQFAFKLIHWEKGPGGEHNKGLVVHAGSYGVGRVIAACHV